MSEYINIFSLKEGVIVDEVTGEAFCEKYAWCPSSKNCGTLNCSAVVHDTKAKMEKINMRYPLKFENRTLNL